jgi:hypothetical protein
MLVRKQVSMVLTRPVDQDFPFRPSNQAPSPVRCGAVGSSGHVIVRYFLDPKIENLKRKKTP